MPRKKISARSRQCEINATASAVKRLYSNSAPLLICEALLFIVAGVFLLVRPVAVMSMLTFIMGIGLVLFGLYRTTSGFVTAKNYGSGWFDVLFGLINVVLGMLFCVYPVGSLVGVIYIFVVLFLFKAIRALVFAINMVRARFGHYIFNLIMSVLLVGLALLLLFFPLVAVVTTVYVLAFMMFVYSIADVYMFIELRRLKRIVE